MARTDSAAVEDILHDNYDGVTSLTPFIDTASILVDRLEAADTAGTMSAAELEIVERWLAAHFYAMVDQIPTSKSTGRASASFQGKTDMGLSGSKYGQTAIIMDRSSYLTGLDQEIKTGQVITDKTLQGTWLGTPPT